MSYEAQAQRGRLADDVLNNEVYQEAYALIEQELVALWKKSESQEDREKLHLLMRTATRFRSILESTMQEGRIAMEILEKDSLPRRIGRAFRNF